LLQNHRVPHRRFSSSGATNRVYQTRERRCVEGGRPHLERRPRR
jgi:hypothetical protein